MTNLKPQQRRVLNTIKVFQAEYQGEVPNNILKLELDIPEEDLTSILGFLEQDGYISINSGMINFVKEPSREGGDASSGISQPDKDEITLKSDVKVDEMINELDKKDNKNNMGNGDNENKRNNVDNAENPDNPGGVETEVKDRLSEKEQRAMDIIQKLVDDSGNISRSLLEGTLLYGELELSSISMYNLVTSLENKGILKKIQLIDGEYYKFTP